MVKTIFLLGEMALQRDLLTDLKGGGEQVFVDTIEMLKSMGHNVVVFQFSEENRVAKFRGHKIYGIGNLTKGGNYAQEYENGIKYFIQQAEKNNADGIYYLSMNLAMLPSKIPSVVVSHGVFWNDYQKNTYLNPIKHLDMMKRALRVCTKMISCDTDTCHQASVWCPEYVNKLEYICNYVDLDLFKPTQGKNDGIFRIISPRRLDYARGFIQAEQMIDILFSKYNNIEMTFCGQGNEQETKQFTEWKSKYSDKQVKHIIKEHYLMPYAYEGMDLGLVPTVKCEGTSLALLELLASNIVPITTWVGGLSDISVNNFTAFVVNPNDSIAMAEKVEYAMNNPVHMQEMRENGQRFIKHFSKKRWDEQIKKVFIDAWGLN